MIGYKQPKMGLKDALKDTLMKFRKKNTKKTVNAGKTLGPNLATGLVKKFNSGMMHK
jgi:hypothetical protein